MLTKDEQDWLNDREIFFAGLGCYVWDGYYWDEGSPFEDMKEAAEFEARVAAKLANPQWAVCWNSDSCLEFGGSKDEPRWWWNCEWCRLKHARLQVEEEMNAYR